jgi:hypothetical protein
VRFGDVDASSLSTQKDGDSDWDVLIPKPIKVIVHYADRDTAEQALEHMIQLAHLCADPKQKDK